MGNSIEQRVAALESKQRAAPDGYTDAEKTLIRAERFERLARGENPPPLPWAAGELTPRALGRVARLEQAAQS